MRYRNYILVFSGKSVYDLWFNIKLLNNNNNNIYVIRFCSIKSALYASTVCLNKVHSLLTSLTKLTIEFSVDISPSACQANLHNMKHLVVYKFNK